MYKYKYIYIYIYVCVCVCVCVLNIVQPDLCLNFETNNLYG